MTTATAVNADTGLADDLQDLYRKAKAEVGDDDLAHIRNVTAYGQAINARRIELLHDGSPRAIVRAAVLEMLYRVMQFSELGHNIIHGSYDDLPNGGEYHSERYQWDFNVDVDHWKVMHHEGHHPNTNVIGKDHDLGYSIARGMAGQDWYGHHVAQSAIIAGLLAAAPQAAPFFLANVARLVAERPFLSSYTLRAPAEIAARDAVQRYLREPLSTGSKFLPAVVSNYFGGVAGYSAVLFLVLIEHHAGELEIFADPGPDETRDQYYERQFRATRNFLRSPELDNYLERVLHEEVPFDNRPDFRIFYGGLDTHVEHHLFPDLPPSKQREIAPAVREIAARYGLPYHETPLLDTVPMMVKVLAGLSIPLGEREFGRPLRLLAQPLSLVRRLAFGATYKTLPEAPYLDKPRFYNVPVKVLSSRSVAKGQARSVRLQKPRGWDDVTWEAGAFVSIRVEVGGEVLVRQYSLVRDSDSSNTMEICIKRVVGGRASNLLNDELRAGKYVTLVGVPTTSGGLAMQATPRKSLFIAGGVGITPIISQLRRIAREASGSDAVLLYFNRDDRSIIFERELRDLARRSGITVHFFTDRPSRRNHVTSDRLSELLIKRHVGDLAERETFVCAPPAMIDIAQRALSNLGLPDERFHTESFTTPELERPVDDGSRYTVRFRRSDSSVEINGATTLLEAASRAGIRVPTGCERGLCRACVTPKLSGTTQLEADGAQLARITVCNSLACSDIELDL
ncbi:fatty acid desaturase [Antrihabitans stalactiti]|uniref:2Fe-2S iron-sulfur cluster binding domain-containing protein n=1 Tax=Antrihabitans stalactiti TaxID=2584121 RepID=A0A848KGJ9_9NOCA|nr:fatty acid desaturase [Antrihabitans stalactiti]NMN95832.1 2Fe-2S iron-sulfur cluster binding domain-containing protein [Antrihabitans stalactiti]